jgi:type I site-specific restriction endonuclease
MPPFITDGLRACQIDAVSALEASMAQNRPRALVQMATGAGKTFTTCTLSYRATGACWVQAHPVPCGSRQPSPEK